MSALKGPFAEAGAAINALPAGSDVPDELLPIHGSLSARYRFLVAVGYLLPDDETVYWGTVEVLADSPLSVEQIRDDAVNRAHDVITGRTGLAAPSAGQEIDAYTGQIIWAARRD